VILFFALYRYTYLLTYLLTYLHTLWQLLLTDCLHSCMVTFNMWLPTDVVWKYCRVLGSYVFITTSCICGISLDILRANMPLKLSVSWNFWPDREFALWGRGHSGLWHNSLHVDNKFRCFYCLCIVKKYQFFWRHYCITSLVVDDWRCCIIWCYCYEL